MGLRSRTDPKTAEPISPRYNPAREIDVVAEKWLARLADSDAFIFVTPEYNHSIPGVLKNAIDYIGWELNRKPAAIVSHGAAGGARAAMHLNEILSVSNAVVIPNAVAFHGIELAQQVPAAPPHTIAWRFYRY